MMRFENVAMIVEGFGLTLPTLTVRVSLPKSAPAQGTRAFLSVLLFTRKPTTAVSSRDY
jgi:hypothetical protein